jgi:hypothetical protein
LCADVAFDEEVYDKYGGGCKKDYPIFPKNAFTCLPGRQAFFGNKA